MVEKQRGNAWFKSLQGSRPYLPRIGQDLSNFFIYFFALQQGSRTLLLGVAKAEFFFCLMARDGRLWWRKSREKGMALVTSKAR